MKRTPLVATTFLLVILLSLSAVAETNSTPADSVKYHFNPIVVTATKARGALRDVDATVSVIPASTPRLFGATTVPDALNYATPGIYVTQRGVMGFGVAVGAAGGITLRGVGGTPNTEILMLINGRPDFMGMMGHPLPDAYDLESVDRIEVVRGPASVLYGSNAMGGVINIIQHRVRHPGFESSARVRRGTYNTRVISAMHGGNTGKFDYIVTGSSKHTDGHRPSSQFDGSNGSAHVAYRPHANLEVSVNANIAKYKAYDPGPVTKPYTDHWVDILRQGLDLGLKGKTRLGEVNTKVYGNFGRHDIYDGWHSEDRTLGLTTYLNTKPVTGNLTTVGFDLMRYGGKAENRQRHHDFGEYYITEWAPYVHIRQILSSKAIASAGLRVEHHELFGYEAVPKFGLVLEPASAVTIRFSSGKGFRNPTIRELYLFPAPTPTLKPERLWNNEIGLQLRPSAHVFADLTVFRAKGSNLIRVEGRYPHLKLSNSGEFVHKGFEWDLRWQPNSVFRARFFGSLLDPDQQTRYAPKRRYGLTLIQRVGKAEFSARLNRVEELYGEDFYRERLPDYTLLDLAASVQISPVLGLVLRVENALDTSYQAMLGYPMPGRMFSVELKVGK
ncbi:MAG: TonB-dependent receptor [Calditrichaeota bacterium]|nr:TonB-dependent receptor [Calditrichota bacterium]